MIWLSIIAGLVLLTIGAEALVRGASALARRFGLSELLIGITLVGFGTSSPELVSSLAAAFAGSPGVAVGNVVGSNIANILLILGASALIAPIAVQSDGLRRDAPALALATLAMIGVALTGEFGRIAGGVFLAGLAAYLALAYITEKRAADKGLLDIPHETPGAVLPSIALSLAGLALLAFGAKLLVSGAIEVATALSVSETLIGLTIVAVGTSLPELVTSVVASLRGKSGLALGNVVGSNIYNSLGILGATALIHPVAAPPAIVRFDNWVMLAATAALILFAFTRSRIERWEGALLAVCYAAYIGFLVFNA
ncbi:calcium/sodium antiporter [Hyphococcus luteus]|uniref:Sodium:calcium antiporter n=1 Tax=Hyphococcus luteus TaxID=2058213 RepID=A0A2S7K8U9_9PROT|nr:calcium/sodium antiporter [Marinicaulis flavus]PQA88934.1 sodium:calcium antiporter [Marinicaulis flavus]